MSLKPGMTERRSFGRRSTVQHGWIWIPGQQAMPCVVENSSVMGALIACSQALALPPSFELSIAPNEFRVPCEVKHRTSTHVGVRFCTRKAADPAPRPNRIGRAEIDQWTGGRRT